MRKQLKKFKIVKDGKHTIWNRATYIIEANSLEEAKKKIEREEPTPKYSEWLYNTVEPISLAENYAMVASKTLLAGTGLLETEAQNEAYNTIYYPEELNYEIKTN